MIEGRERGGSSTAGRRVNAIGCRRWRPIWSAAGRRDRRLRRDRCGVRGQGGDHDDPDRLRASPRSGRLGLVASLARPGGNATGFNYFESSLAAKRLELLQRAGAARARVAVLVNPADAASYRDQLRDVEAAASLAIGLQIQVLNASTAGEIDARLRDLVRERPNGGLFVGSDRSSPAGASTCHHACGAPSRLPAIYRDRATSSTAGGLMSYGTTSSTMLSSGRRLRRPHSQGRQAGRPAGACSRPNSSWSSTSRPPRRSASRAADAARPRRRGDRMSNGASSSRCSAARRRVAARGARAAAERMRRIGVLAAPQTSDDAECQARVAAFLQGLQQCGLDRSAATCGSTRAGPRPTPPTIRRHAAELAALAPDVILAHGAATVASVAAGDPHRADRVRDRRRSGRRRLRRQPGAAGRQRHRFHDFRIQHRREMAGAAQARSRRG